MLDVAEVQNAVKYINKNKSALASEEAQNRVRSLFEFINNAATADPDLFRAELIRIKALITANSESEQSSRVSQQEQRALQNQVQAQSAPKEQIPVRRQIRLEEQVSQQLVEIIPSSSRVIQERANSPANTEYGEDPFITTPVHKYANQYDDAYRLYYSTPVDDDDYLSVDSLFDSDTESSTSDMSKYYKLDIKPFEGGNMRQYVKRFVIECETKKVPQLERASYLRAKLDGDAFNTFDRLPEAAKNTNDFDAFCNTLYAKFNNPAQLSNARKQFDHLQQDESSVADYARRVYDLGLMSLDPTTHREEERNDLIKQKFISGLRPELQGFVRTFAPLTFDEAKHYALSLEADTIVNLSRRVESLTKQFERMQSPGTSENMVGYTAQDPRQDDLVNKLRQRIAELEGQQNNTPQQQHQSGYGGSQWQNRGRGGRDRFQSNRRQQSFGNPGNRGGNRHRQSPIQCRNCGRSGHYARECWRPNAYQQQQQWHSSYHQPPFHQPALGSYAVHNQNSHVAYQQPHGQYQPQPQYHAPQYTQPQYPMVECPPTPQPQPSSASSSQAQQSWFQVTMVNCGPHDQTWTEVPAESTEAEIANKSESQRPHQAEEAVQAQKNQPQAQGQEASEISEPSLGTMQAGSGRDSAEPDILIIDESAAQSPPITTKIGPEKPPEPETPTDEYAQVNLTPLRLRWLKRAKGCRKHKTHQPDCVPCRVNSKAKVKKQIYNWLRQQTESIRQLRPGLTNVMETPLGQRLMQYATAHELWSEYFGQDTLRSTIEGEIDTVYRGGMIKARGKAAKRLKEELCLDELRGAYRTALLNYKQTTPEQPLAQLPEPELMSQSPPPQIAVTESTPSSLPEIEDIVLAQQHDQLRKYGDPRFYMKPTVTWKLIPVDVTSDTQTTAVEQQTSATSATTAVQKQPHGKADGITFIHQHLPCIEVSQQKQSTTPLNLPCEAEEATADQVKTVLATMTSKNQQGFLVKEIKKLKQEHPEIDTAKLPKVTNPRGGRSNAGSSKRATWLAKAMWHAGLLALITTLIAPASAHSQWPNPLICNDYTPAQYFRLPDQTQCANSSSQHSSGTKGTPATAELVLYKQNIAQYTSKAVVCKKVTVTTKTFTYFVPWLHQQDKTIVHDTVSSAECTQMQQYHACSAGQMKLMDHGTYATDNEIKWKWGGAGAYCCYWISVKTTNCYIYDALVYKTHNNKMESTAGDVSHCSYKKEQCALQSGEFLVWRANTTEECQYVEWMRTRAHVLNDTVITEDGNIALTQSTNHPVKACGRYKITAALLSDQGVAYKLHFLSEAEPSTVTNSTLKSRQTRQDFEGAEYVAAQLQALQQNMLKYIHFTFQTAVTNACTRTRHLEDMIRASLLSNPTLQMRSLLNDRTIVAKAGGDTIDVRRCIELNDNEFRLKRMNATCYDEIPVQITIQGEIYDAFMDPHTNVVQRGAPRLISCIQKKTTPITLGNQSLLYLSETGTTRHLQATELPLYATHLKELPPQKVVYHALLEYSIDELRAHQSLNDIYANMDRQTQIWEHLTARGTSTSIETEANHAAINILDRGLFNFFMGLPSPKQIWIFLCCLYITLEFLFRWCLPTTQLRQAGTIPSIPSLCFSLGRKVYYHFRPTQQPPAGEEQLESIELQPLRQVQHQYRPSTVQIEEIEDERQLARVGVEASSMALDESSLRQWRPIFCDRERHLVAVALTTTISGLACLLPAWIENRRVLVLPDTGSPLSFLAIRVARALKLLVQPPILGQDLRPTDFNGNVISIVGTTSIKLQIGQKIFTGPINVSPNCPFDAVIGRNTMQALGKITFDYDEGIFQLGGTNIPMVKIEDATKPILFQKGV